MRKITYQDRLRYQFDNTDVTGTDRFDRMAFFDFCCISVMFCLDRLDQWYRPCTGWWCAARLRFAAVEQSVAQYGRGNRRG